MSLHVIERHDARKPAPQVLTSRHGSPYLFTGREIEQKVTSLNNLRGSAFVEYKAREYK